MAAGIGYRDEKVEPDNTGGVSGTRQFWGGSASIMHTPSGLFVDGAYGNSDGWQTIKNETGFGTQGLIAYGDGRLEIMAGRAGFSKKITNLGATTIYGEYGQLKFSKGDFADVDIDPRFWGAGVSQDIAGAAATIYLSGRQYDLDINEPDVDDTFYVIMGGVKVRF